MDGRIRITYLKVDATSGLAGLSAGGGLPSDFVASDWTAHSPCAGAAPGFVTEPANQSSPPGGLAVFHTTVSGSLPLFYQWLHNGVNLVDGPRVSGAKSQTLVLSNLEENDSGAYLVRVFNANGSIESSNAFLLVSPVDHFVWAHIPLPQADNVPFLISLEAQDAANMTVSNYNSAVTLMPIGGGASIVPVVLTNFVDGMWIGTARVIQAVTNVTIKAMDAFGHAGLSEPITILPQPILNLDSSGGMMNLSWTAGAPSLVLEKTPTLSPAQWAPFGTPVSVGDTWFIQVDTTDSQGFFRLHSSSP
jgi:hypothetical protein